LRTKSSGGFGPHQRHRVGEHARSEGMPISFLACFKVEAPLTVITLAAGTA